MAKILLVEDDLDLAKLVKSTLAIEHHQVEWASDGFEAKGKLKLFGYDLIILDWQLPKATGVEICKQYRQDGGITPILMLTSKSSSLEKEEGLDAGSDDYLTKPFDTRELLARVRALLRRPPSLAGTQLKAQGLVLDTASSLVTLNGETLHLSPKEYALLEFFMRHPNQVFSADALLQRVWTSDSLASLDTVRTYIKTLRKKIDSTDTSLLRTVHSVGYVFEPKPLAVPETKI